MGNGIPDGSENRRQVVIQSRGTAMDEKKEEKGRWMEEYKTCGCSFVAKLRRELPGYCSRHGTDRRRVTKLPKAIEAGYAG